ncbi:MAG: hypothetical protein R2710_31335 [Acidimicrobiales bacterium]
MALDLTEIQHKALEDARCLGCSARSHRLHSHGGSSGNDTNDPSRMPCRGFSRCSARTAQSRRHHDARPADPHRPMARSWPAPLTATVPLSAALLEPAAGLDLPTDLHLIAVEFLAARQWVEHIAREPHVAVKAATTGR